MSRFGSRLLAGATALTLGLTAALPASAEWRRAESERFVVYSEGSESTLRSYVRRLEIFDRVLNVKLTNSMGEAPGRKLPIYLVGSRAGLVRVRPDVGENVAGYYMTSREDIFALGIREAGDETLLHEYAHHFMFQNSAYPYPSWFVEGFAEYYMTAEFKSDRVLLGKPNAARTSWLAGSGWLDMRALLSTRPGKRARGSNTYYPLAWLLTHWFWGNVERQQQLDAYLRDVGAGGDPVEAMQRVTGMDITQLRRELRRYMNGRIPNQAVIMDIPEVPMTVTVLPPSADAMLLLGQRVKLLDKDDADAATVLAEVRRQAARFPGDTLAELILARAEMAVGDGAAGERAANAVLEREPDKVEAMQLLAEHDLEAAYASDDNDERTRLMVRAQRHLGRAFQVDGENYLTFMLLARLRSGQSGYPNDNDLATLEFAHALAPQLPDTVLNLASVLIETGQQDRAVAMLEPLANSPHGGGGASAARAMINEVKGITAEQDDASEGEAEPEGEGD